MGECFGWGGSRGWGSCEAGWTDVGGSASVLMASVRRGWWVLHTRVHPASVGTAESRGTAMSVAVVVVVVVMLPCA